MSVRMEQLGFHWLDLMKFYILSIFPKYVRHIEVLWKLDKNNGYLTWGSMYIFDHISLTMKIVSDKSCRKKKHFVFSNFLFFRKSCRLWGTVENYCRVGQATDDSMAHAHCRLDTKGYKYTISISNTYCISIVTMVARKRLIVILFVQYIAGVVKA